MKASKGFTLIEVVVSVLITAVMVSSVFSISLTATQSNVRADRKLIAAQASRSLTSTLQSYVSGDAASTGGAVINGIIAGPGASWALPGDTLGAGSYALSDGTHTVANTGTVKYVPEWFTSTPYNAKLYYYVVHVGPAGNQLPWVNVTVTWTEP